MRRILPTSPKIVKQIFPEKVMIFGGLAQPVLAGLVRAHDGPEVFRPGSCAALHNVAAWMRRCAVWSSRVGRSKRSAKSTLVAQNPNGFCLPGHMRNASFQPFLAFTNRVSTRRLFRPACQDASLKIPKGAQR
jgi:hypothetical protein